MSRLVSSRLRWILPIMRTFLFHFRSNKKEKWVPTLFCFQLISCSHAIQGESDIYPAYFYSSHTIATARYPSTFFFLLLRSSSMWIVVHCRSLRAEGGNILIFADFFCRDVSANVLQVCKLLQIVQTWAGGGNPCEAEPGAHARSYETVPSHPYTRSCRHVPARCGQGGEPNSCLSRAATKMGVPVWEIETLRWQHDTPYSFLGSRPPPAPDILFATLKSINLVSICLLVAPCFHPFFSPTVLSKREKIRTLVGGGGCSHSGRVTIRNPLSLGQVRALER